MMIKKILCITLCVFLFMIPAALASSSIEQQRTIPRFQSNGNDDWEMFHHDLQRTGFSSSNAPNSNNVRRTYEIGYPILRSSPTISKGRIYIASYDMYLYCFDQNTGQRLWRYFLYDRYVYSSAAVADGKVYIGGANMDYYGCLICLDAQNGTLLWEYANEEVMGIWSSPAVFDGKVYFGSNGYFGGRLYCLDARTGQEIWNYTTGTVGDTIISSPALLNNRVYVGVMYNTGDGDVVCLNASTGVPIWNYLTIGYIETSPAIMNNKVYVTTMKYGSALGYLYCLNADNGSFLWKFRTYNYIKSSPAVAYGNVYFGSKDAFFYCLNAETGEQRWSYETGDSVDTSAAVADGKVYVGSDDGYLYCFNATNGAWIWDYCLSGDATFPAPVESSPTICDGVVYIGCLNGNVYAFEDAVEIGEITGGLGVGAAITNVGNRDFIDITWHITIDGIGIFNKMTDEKTGILPPLPQGETMMIKKVFFGFGRVRINVSAYPPEVTPITKTVEGFLFGSFIHIKK